MPLLGKGVAPCPLEGSLAEVRLKGIRVDEGFVVRFNVD